MAQISAARPPVGTVFSFTLDERALVEISFMQHVSGRRVHGSCIAQTKLNSHAPTCKRTVNRGALALSAGSGAARIAFEGRLSRTHRLSPGFYTAIVVASNAAKKRSLPKQLGFTIVG